MPYKLDPRRTVTLNLPPAEYAALTEDALQAGYASAGTYAQVLVRARGEAPDPIQDQRTANRQQKLENRLAWLQAQFEALGDQLRRAGYQPLWAEVPFDEPRPRSWSAQQRALKRAVARVLENERAAVVQAADTSPKLPWPARLA